MVECGIYRLGRISVKLNKENNMVIALQIISGLTVALPTLIKVIKWIMAASAELNGKTGEEKMMWVMSRLQTELPKLNGDQIYDWVKGVLYLLRTFGVKV